MPTSCHSRFFLFFITNGFAIAYTLFIAVVMFPVILMLGSLPMRSAGSLDNHSGAHTVMFSSCHVSIIKAAPRLEKQQ